MTYLDEKVFRSIFGGTVLIAGLMMLALGILSYASMPGFVLAFAGLFFAVYGAVIYTGGQTPIKTPQDKLYCKKCGKEVKQDFNLCPYCGEKLVIEKK